MTETPLSWRKTGNTEKCLLKLLLLLLVVVVALLSFIFLIYYSSGVFHCHNKRFRYILLEAFRKCIVLCIESGGLILCFI